MRLCHRMNVNHSPIDQEILVEAAASTSVALITGEIPVKFIGSGEFRGYVTQDGRACADRLWFVNPDGTGAGLPACREQVRNQPRTHSAYCRVTEDMTAIRIIIPAADVWTAPAVIYAKVATAEQSAAISACYE